MHNRPCLGLSLGALRNLLLPWIVSVGSAAVSVAVAAPADAELTLHLRWRAAMQQERGDQAQQSTRAEDAPPRKLPLGGPVVSISEGDPDVRRRAAALLLPPSSQVVFETVRWDPKQTAAIVCDMWDDHWCTSAAERVAEMAPVINRSLAELRRRGVLIVHAPSGTMEYYRDRPQRRRALDAPAVKFDPPLIGWCKLDPRREPPLPIDDRQGGCDTPGLEQRRAWSKQIDAIEIAPEDALGDGFEILYLLEQRGIRHVLIMGVHTNMCVLGRPFGIRQLVYQGKNVVLVRDLTDAMYDPAAEPKISHFGGTARVIAHIERYWCPTIESVDILGGAPFRFRGDRRPHIVMLVNEDEYSAEQTLARWAADLELRYDFATTVIQGRGAYRLDGIETLDRADAVVLYVRRRPIPPEQLDVLRRYLARGKPLLALRTSSHAFALRGGTPLPQGVESWPDFDRQVLGCEYQNHLGNRSETAVQPVAPMDDPLLAGIDRSGWKSRGSLYRSVLVDPQARVLLEGSAEGSTYPTAWLRSYGTAEVFYTSLGHPDDFEEPNFMRLLENVLHRLLRLGRFAPQPTPANR